MSAPAPRKAQQATASGLLLLDKPAGLTSFDCIRTLKRAWQRTDLGHGGTLDMFATGVLPILVGEGLKLARFFLESYPALPTYWKSYRAVMCLGCETSTGDPSGEPGDAVTKPLELTSETVHATMASFVGGPYLQTPPVFSAKKFDGRRASDLARAGAPPQMKPVAVTIKELVLQRLGDSEIEFDVICSKGTYVRVLAEDLARRLGTRAHLTSLRRTAVGRFSLNQTCSWDDAQNTGSQHLLPLREAVSFLPRLYVEAPLAHDLARGKVDAVLEVTATQPPGVYCVQDAGGTPLALTESLATQGAGPQARFLRAFRADVNQDDC